MSQPIIIGIDHGYAAMKTAHCSFPTGLVAYTHEPYSNDHVLEYDGQFYVIGSERQGLQKDKTATEDYYLLTLAAIAMELEARKLPGEAKVTLAAGLPLTSFGRDKKTFRQYLLRDSKPLDFRYEGRPYRITIKDVQLFPQGYSAVIWQPELLEQPSAIVADIGGWTVDLMEVDNQVPNAATCRSLELGVIRCLNEISEQLSPNPRPVPDQCPDRKRAPGSNQHLVQRSAGTDPRRRQSATQPASFLLFRSAAWITARAPCPWWCWAAGLRFWPAMCRPVRACVGFSRWRTRRRNAPRVSAPV